VDGPKSASDPQAIANQRRADGMRKQFVNRVRQFNDLPEARQEKTRPQLAKEHKRTSLKLKQYGFDAPTFESLIADANSWKQLEAKPPAAAATQTIESLVEDAYLRTLSRYPDPEETETSVSFIAESSSPADGVQSLLWALVNTKEFIITH
jgi:hypothetical protein